MTTRVVVLGAGAAGLSGANRLALHAASGVDLEVVLVERAGDHLFAPGLVGVLLGDSEPAAVRRPVAELVRPGVRLVAGEVTGVDPDARLVRGSFGELAYDELVVALGAETGWPSGPPACGDLAPWTLAGALAGREALRGLRAGARVVVGPATPAYRCPPAVFDLAVRIRRATGAAVEVVHPWPRPLAPFGEAPAAAFEAMLARAGVGFVGGFALEEVGPGELRARSGASVAYDVALVVPPHRGPAVLARSGLAGPEGWPAVRFPRLDHPAHPNVAFVGDLAAPALQAGMAGTLALLQAAFVADRIAAAISGVAPPERPRLEAICFVDEGDTGSFLHCDFEGPASRTGPAACVLMPRLPYFRSAKQLFATEWFTTTLSGGVG